jgi:hypothetical protein
MVPHIVARFIDIPEYLRVFPEGARNIASRATWKHSNVRAKNMIRRGAQRKTRFAGELFFPAIEHCAMGQ